jgi:hypothetical protein
VAQVFHGNYAVPSDFLRAWAPCPCKAVLVIEGRVEDRLMAAGKAMRVCSCTAIDLKGLVQGIVDSFLAARFPQLNDKQRAAISMIASSGQDSKPALIVGRTSV